MAVEAIHAGFVDMGNLLYAMNYHIMHAFYKEISIELLASLRIGSIFTMVCSPFTKNNRDYPMITRNTAASTLEQESWKTWGCPEISVKPIKYASDSV